MYTCAQIMDPTVKGPKWRSVAKFEISKTVYRWPLFFSREIRAISVDMHADNLEDKNEKKKILALPTECV